MLDHKSKNYNLWKTFFYRHLLSTSKKLYVLDNSDIIVKCNGLKKSAYLDVGRMVDDWGYIGDNKVDMVG